MRILLIFLFLAIFVNCKNINEQSDFLILLEKSRKFNQALISGDFFKIYNLFNPTFRKEISYDSFKSAFENWLKDKNISAVRTKFINPTGYTAIVSTYIYFNKNKDYFYLATNWINLNDTWYLVWITKVLDYAKFDYGNKNNEELKKVLKKMIEVAFQENQITEFIPGFKKTDYLVILKKERKIEHQFSFEKLRIKWLTIDEIKKYTHRLKLRYYIDFGTIRIFDNFAKGYLDIIPIIYESQKKLHLRRRGIEMFFKKVNNEWQFAGFGSRW
jgi:hypothetical protein